MIATKLRRIAKVNIKSILRKAAYGYKAESSSYIKHLRSIGMKIGSDCIIYVPTKTLIDEQYPWMITIGDHVRITEGVKILTHDYAWSVLKTEKGAILGASGTVKIGDNVFIGMNTVITRNVEIGNNVIIGAGSVVTSNCDHNCVYAGVPAKRIMSIDEYYEKRERAQFNEAKKLAVEYFDRYGKRPGKEVFHEYFMLFETAEEAQKNDVFRNKIALCQNELDTVKYMSAHKAMFSSYDEFIEKCFEKCTNCVKEQSK